jgi:hypothetical protein
MGFHTCVLLLVVLAGCSDGDLGAVSVRWRIVDQETSIGYDPNDLPNQGDGSCLGPDWVVHNVRIQINEPDTGEPVPVDMNVVVFGCHQREATTTFNIPLGRFAFDLCPFGADPLICNEGVTPAPLIRIIKQAEIINLDVIEIGVRSHNMAPPNVDSGVADAGSPP